MARKADVNIAGADGTTALRAAWSGDVETVRALIGAGATVNAKNHYNVSALSLAAEARTIPSSACSRERAPIRIISGMEKHCLMTAARAGNPLRVKMLIGAGADVNAGSPLKATALMMAAGNNHGAAVKLARRCRSRYQEPSPRGSGFVVGAEATRRVD